MNCLSFHWITVTFCLFVHPEAASSCGELLTGRKGEIKTPNFPRNYDNNLDCTWTLEVDKRKTIVIEFIEFKIETSGIPLKDCADKFSVYDGPDTDSSKQLSSQPCGDKIPKPLHSTGNVLTLTFTSDSWTKKKGVSLKWRDTFTLHTEAKTWTEANDACLNDGGHLAVESDLNKQLILNLIDDSSDSLWIGEYYTPWIWLQGCYKDRDLKLTSSKRYVETKDNEAKVCEHHCQDTVYFGLRGSKCYCLTTEDMDELQFSESWYECKIPCPGHNKEKCGGAFSLTVYMNDVCWKNSSTWVAKISKTISGKTCQAWSSDFPHAHAFHDDDMFPDGSETLASNYCRDPDGKGAPWCFTTDLDVPWQFCDAPPCPGTCWSDPTKYSGHLNVSVHGHKCANWTDDSPFPYDDYHDASEFPDTTVAEAFNYCRSPSGYPSLWCFVDGRYEFCGAPPCFDSEKEEEIGKLCRVFWAKGSKFYLKQHSCDDKEFYSCFTNETLSNFMVPDGNDTYSDRYVKHGFSDARDQCRFRYALSNYKNLFGISDYIKLGKDEAGTRPRHWLGNVRGAETTSYEKGGVLKPSACKTTRNFYGTLKTEIQSNCHLPLGFICQKDALLCGDKFYNDSGTISTPGYPDNYDHNEYCEWEIHVAERKSIEIFFYEIDIEKHTNCSFDYLEVFEEQTRLGKLCGKLSNISVISSSNHVIVKFRSDKDVQGKGFHLEWTSALLPTTTSTTSTSTTNTPSEHFTTTSKMGPGNITDKRIDGATLSTTSKSISITSSEHLTTTSKKDPGSIADKRIDGDSKTGESTLSGATLAGIIIGVVLALVVVVVIVLVVLVLRRKKHQKAETETIMQLKALESTSAAETPQQDVYNSPIPKALRQPKQPISEKTAVPDTDDTYYHHLHQTNVKRPSPDDTGNPYQGLHSPELYDHTSNLKPNQTNAMQLKALEGASAAPAPSNADTPQQDVYSSPIPMSLRQPNQPISEKVTEPDTDDTYYHHLHQMNVRRPNTDDTGNPYQGLHSPELYDHTLDSKPNQTDDMYDHFDSNKTDLLDNAGLQQNQNVYDCTTSSVAPSNRNNTVQTGKTGLLDKERNEIVGNEYMSMNSNNESGKQSTKAACTDNYLTPIGDHINDLTGRAANADIQENDRTETDGNDKEVDIEKDTYYNVSVDKSNEHDDSDQHLYEMDDAGQVYEIV